MGCVSSRIPDIIGEGYHLKVKKTVAVGGSAKVFSISHKKRLHFASNRILGHRPKIYGRVPQLVARLHLKTSNSNPQEVQ